MASTDLVYVGPGGLRDEHRQHRREMRRFWSRLALAFAVVMGSVLVATVWVNRPERAADASPIEPTTVASLAPEWSANPTPTTAIVPEAVPAAIQPLWVTIRVTVPGWDGLGKLLTDGQPGHARRVLPGDPGQAVIAIDGDPSMAQTVVIEGQEWRVFFRGQVASNDLASLTDVHPIVPTVVLVSTQPGDARNYVQARR